MKHVLFAILIILYTIAFFWLMGAMPSDEEISKGQMMKIDQELRRYE